MQHTPSSENTPRNRHDRPATGPVGGGKSVPPAGWVEFCGERFALTPGLGFSIGRRGDIEIHDSTFPAEAELRIVPVLDLWLVSSSGTGVYARSRCVNAGFEALISPGAQVPLVFATQEILLTVGPTTYEFLVTLNRPVYVAPREGADAVAGVTGVPGLFLTEAQRILILALSESLLRGGSRAPMAPNTQLARSLGWTPNRFARTLTSACTRVDRLGASGLPSGLITHGYERREVLAQLAISTGIATLDALAELDEYRAIHVIGE
ncbi:hypothetical protein D9V32_01340 [Mycetocola tolaasinivorans]|uniref:Uncharacterized protein n=1 Tax=Mycetocola tolaasinivorans TaxID=76635 RepID=A0A3L7ADE9_9MICO|nr:hypothetical protein [Mycetocola tolaasinivorans]RLP78004.1 hypothetical protein D9V32_01340 [Mycetocola tolaasinivorans]